jgi:hypothetical protein
MADYLAGFESAVDRVMSNPTENIIADVSMSTFAFYWSAGWPPLLFRPMRCMQFFFQCRLQFKGVLYPVAPLVGRPHFHELAGGGRRAGIRAHRAFQSTIRTCHGSCVAKAASDDAAKHKCMDDECHPAAWDDDKAVGRLRLLCFVMLPAVCHSGIGKVCASGCSW